MTAATLARASVYAAGVDTDYIRAGQGDAVVLLAPSLASPAVHGEIARLAKHYLVIAAAPPGDVSLHEWLDGFMEGLGCGDAHVMLHSSIWRDFPLLRV